MKKILVSACLMGKPVRYDGGSKSFSHQTLERWQNEGRLVAVCPELLGGFSTPRPPAEIKDCATGDDILRGKGRVVEVGGRDVTEQYLRGAEGALSLARSENCVAALLMDGSPSCGSSFIHDGNFGGKTHVGVGVTTALLRSNGIPVYSTDKIHELEAWLASKRP